MDLIGKIHPTSSKGHNFILIAIDYVTKWVQTVPLKKAEQKDVIKIIKEQIIHRIGIPQSITTDQGTMFTGKEMNYFARDYGIQLIKSTPFYAQANGQAEAYKTSKRSCIGISPFSLTYGQDAILPMEVVVPSLRVSRKNGLAP